MAVFHFYLQLGKQRKVGWVGDGSHVVFSSKNSLMSKSKYETVHCRDATASSFIAEVRGEVFARFHAVALKRHSSMRNWLFGLLGRILCQQSPWCKKKMMIMLLTLSRWVCTFHVLLMLSPRTFVKSFPGSPSHCLGGLHKIWCCSYVGAIAKSHQVRYTAQLKRTWKLGASTQLREIVYTSSKDVLVLPLPLHRATTNAVQIAAPVPEIMDTPP
jgi:hypothetical protein